MSFLLLVLVLLAGSSFALLEFTLIFPIVLSEYCMMGSYFLLVMGPVEFKVVFRVAFDKLVLSLRGLRSLLGLFLSYTA